MHLRMGEIRKPSGMIQVQIGQNNVPNIACLESQLFNLADRRFALKKFRTKHLLEPGGDITTEIGDFLEPKAGVDKNQTLVGFYEKTMADQKRRRAVDQLSTEGAE